MSAPAPASSAAPTQNMAPTAKPNDSSSSSSLASVPYVGSVTLTDVIVIVVCVVVCCALSICLWYFTIFTDTEETRARKQQQQKSGVISLSGGAQPAEVREEAPIDGEENGSPEAGESENEADVVGMDTVRDSLSGGYGPSRDSSLGVGRVMVQQLSGQKHMPSPTTRSSLLRIDHDEL